MARAFNDISSATSLSEFGGKLSTEAMDQLSKRAPWQMILKKSPPTKGGILEKIRATNEQDMLHFFHIQASMEPVKEVLKSKVYSKELKGLIRGLSKLDKRKSDEMMAVQEFLGVSDFAPLERHLMQSRTWRGTHRIRIVDGEGRHLGMGSGFSRAEAVEDATAVAARANQLISEGNVSGSLAKAKGEVKALTDEVFNMGKDEDLFSLLEPQSLTGHHMATVDAFDRAFAEQYKKLPVRFRQQHEAIGYSQFHRVPKHSDIEDLVLKLAHLADDCGLDGIVCSPQELGRLCGESFDKIFFVTPGIRPEGTSKDDQTRTNTAAGAIQSGARHLVIGRPITQADNPASAAEAIVKEIQRAKIGNE